MSMQIGAQFQERTKYHRERMPERMPGWSVPPETYKDYPGNIRVSLPAAASASQATLDQTLRTRRSVRDFSKESISLSELAYLIWAATGIQRTEHGHEFRTAPSAGALYPIETYLVANNVDGLAKGVYHYDIRGHLLEELHPGDHAHEIARAALDQGMCVEAAAVFVWTAVFRRCAWKYGDRAYRYVYLDAGHIAENLALAAVALGLGTCQIAALYDDESNRLLGVDGVEESVIYMSVVGHPD